MRSRCILKVILDWTDVFSGEYLLPTNVSNVFLNNKFLSWRFQMMNLNLPSEFSALNFCFDLTVTLCSIPKWNLLKILSRTRISSWTKKMIQISNVVTVREKHLLLVSEFTIFQKVAKQGSLKRTHESFHLTWLWKFYNLHWNPDFIKIYSVSKSLRRPRIPFLTLFHFFNISISAPTLKVTFEITFSGIDFITRMSFGSRGPWELRCPIVKERN